MEPGAKLRTPNAAGSVARPKLLKNRCPVLDMLLGG